jgi:hypothetical protein
MLTSREYLLLRVDVKIELSILLLIKNLRVSAYGMNSIIVI